MDLNAIRSELGDLAAAAGWNVYDYTPGATSLPAVVVGMPDNVTPGPTAGFWSAQFPVYVLTRSADPATAERTILAQVVALAAVYRNTGAGTAYRTIRLVEIRDFYDVTTGNTEANAGSIIVEIIAPAPTP